MNYPFYTILISWQSRNWRHVKLAETMCKDHGLKKVHKDLYIGSFKEKEKNLIKNKLNRIFFKNHEKFSIITLCKDCVNEIELDMPWLETDFKVFLKKMDFEIVGSPKNP